MAWTVYISYSLELSRTDDHRKMSQDPDPFQFKPTLNLSDTLKLPSKIVKVIKSEVISKSVSETNLARSRSSGKSILKSKSETQLVSILKGAKEPTENDILEEYLDGGYAEVVKEHPKRPELRYTKSESRSGTYGFDTNRYESRSYSYRGKSKGVDPTGPNSYTRSLEHFTLKVVDESAPAKPTKRKKSLADTLEFPREYKYDHYTLKGDKLGEYQTRENYTITTNTVTLAPQQPYTPKPSPSRSSSSGSNSSNSSSGELWMGKQVRPISTPIRQGQQVTQLPVNHARCVPTSQRSPITAARSNSTAPRLTQNTASSLRNSLIVSGPPRLGIHPPEPLQWANTPLRTTAVRLVAPKPASPTAATPPVSHYSLSHGRVNTKTSKSASPRPTNAVNQFFNSAAAKLSALAQRSSSPGLAIPVPASEPYVTKPHIPANQVNKNHVTNSNSNSNVDSDLLASIAHVGPLVTYKPGPPKKPEMRDQGTQTPMCNRPPYKEPPVNYHASKVRAVEKLRNRQLMQSRGVRVLPPSPLKWMTYVSNDEVVTELSRDKFSHLPHHYERLVAQYPERRRSLFRQTEPLSSMESRDQCFKQPETPVFKTRDILEVFRFRKPTAFLLTKNLVDELLYPLIRCLLIKQERFHKYALVHSAVTNCNRKSTGWVKDEKTKFFKKAEGPFINKDN